MRKSFTTLFCVLLTAYICMLGSCSNQTADNGSGENMDNMHGDAAKSIPPAVLKLATTTSTENSGLLDVILPDFEKKFNATVKVIAVGTGKALMLGENGDVDLLMVHAPAAEKKFVDAGSGTSRTEFMFNDFVIAGPETDPAGVKRMNDAAAALAVIAEKQAEFISRGDDSGTHKKERELWKKAGIEPGGAWYLEVGRGMGAVLTMASEKQSYTLTDRGTYLSMIKNINMIPLVEGDPELNNIYSMIPVNPEVHEHVNIELSKKFVEWISSKEVQEMIASYTVNGKELFTPLLLN